MKIIKYTLNTAFASALLFTMALFQPAVAEEYVTKATAKTIYTGPLPGMEGKEMIVKRFGIPPKFVGGKHMHPGPVFVYVLEGEFSVMLEGGTKTFKAGELYAEGINEAMVAKNISTSKRVELLVFQVGDIGKPMMIKVE